MAVAKKISICEAGENAFFAKSFIKVAIVDPIPLILGSNNWFFIDQNVAGFSLAYLYMVTNMSVASIDFTILRSAGFEGNDTDRAVPIPGAAATQIAGPAGFATTDFSISEFGGDRIWIHADVGAGIIAGEGFTALELMLKP